MIKYVKFTYSSFYNIFVFGLKQDKLLTRDFFFSDFELVVVTFPTLYYWRWSWSMPYPIHDIYQKLPFRDVRSSDLKIWEVPLRTNQLRSFWYWQNNRAFSLTWPAPRQIYWNKRKRLRKKRVQLPQDWFGTPTWPPFHCFGTPIWPPWRLVKTLYTRLI